jgi:hypothetical protein
LPYASLHSLPMLIDSIQAFSICSSLDPHTPN